MKLEEPHERRNELERLAQQRGIDPEILRAAGIRLGTGDRRGWWILPYPHRNGTWKQRYYNPDPGARPKYLDDRGADPHLYNPGLLGPGEDEVWFCEGEFDTLCLIEHGYKAIGVHGVGIVPVEEDEYGLKTGQKDWDAWRLLFEDTKCIVIFDNDDAGRQAGRRLARALDGVVFDEWPEGVNDVNDWHRSDRDGFGDVLAGFSGRVSGGGRLG